MLVLAKSISLHAQLARMQAHLPLLSFLFEPVPGLFPVAVASRMEVVIDSLEMIGNLSGGFLKQGNPDPF